MVAPFSRRRRVVAGPSGAVSPWPFAGMALMAASFFMYAASVLVAPWWAVVVLMLVWLVQFLLCTRWWTPHPTRLVPVAVFSMALWFVLLVGGSRVLDWSA